jgi:hypothetical protein
LRSVRHGHASLRAALGLALLGVLLAAERAPAGGDAASFLLAAPTERVLAPADLVARPPRFPFPVGERLEYAISWFGLPAGTAAIEVARFIEVEGRRYAHVVATARTSPLFSMLYEVDDRSEAWIDLDRFVTVRTFASELHGGQRFEEEVRYDWSTHFLHARLDKLSQRKRREVDFDFGPFAHDTSDLFYALRALPVAPGYRASVATYANRKIFEFRIEVGAPRVVETTAFGATQALAVRPSAWIDGGPYAAGDGVVWVAGDARVPVRLDGWIRTAGSSFLVQGLRLVLLRYVPSADGWSPPDHPAFQGSAAIPTTLRGIPQWTPPRDVQEARRAAGLVPCERRSALPDRSAARPDEASID